MDNTEEPNRTEFGDTEDTPQYQVNDYQETKVPNTTSDVVHGDDQECQEDDEEVGEWVNDGDETKENCLALGLIRKIWSYRTPNPTAFMTTIKAVWVTQHGVDVSVIGKNLYQFQF